ncbi:MAG: hypothetical protein ACHQ7M_16500 [Chloroflexota bacterium]
MRRTFTLFATAAFVLSLAGVADAAACKDAKGKFTKCPVAEASASYTLDAKGNCHDAKGKMAKKTMCAASTTTTATATAPAGGSAMASTTTTAAAGGPKCVKGKRCGNACISVKDVCHK